MDEEGKNTFTVRAVSGDEEGKKRVDMVEVETRNPDTLCYAEKKLHDKGIQRMDRHPIDGLRRNHSPPKAGHGGKFTWEGPDDIIDSELHPVPAAIDGNDPNYVEDEERRGGMDDDRVVGEVEVAKIAEEKDGVSRVEFLAPMAS